MAAKAYVSSMTVAELTSELKKRGLNCRGKKKALQNRLEQALYEEENSESSSEGSNEATIRAALHQLDGDLITTPTTPPTTDKTPLIVSIEHSKRQGQDQIETNGDPIQQDVGKPPDDKKVTDNEQLREINDNNIINQKDTIISQQQTETNIQPVVIETVAEQPVTPPTVSDHPTTTPIKSPDQAPPTNIEVTSPTQAPPTNNDIIMTPVGTDVESEVNSIAVEPPSPNRDDITLIDNSNISLEESLTTAPPAIDDEVQSEEQQYDTAPPVINDDNKKLIEEHLDTIEQQHYIDNDDKAIQDKKEEEKGSYKQQQVTSTGVGNTNDSSDSIDNTNQPQVIEEEGEREEKEEVLTEMMRSSRRRVSYEGEDSNMEDVDIIEHQVEHHQHQEEKHQGQEEKRQSQEEDDTIQRQQDDSSMEQHDQPQPHQQQQDNQSQAEDMIQQQQHQEEEDEVVGVDEEEGLSVFSAEEANSLFTVQQDTPTNNNNVHIEKRDEGLGGANNKEEVESNRKRQSSVEDIKDNESILTKRRRVSTSPSKKIQERKRRWGSSTSNRTPSLSQPPISSDTLETIIPEEVKEEVTEVDMNKVIVPSEEEDGEVAMDTNEQEGDVAKQQVGEDDERGDRQYDEDIVDLGKDSSLLMDEYEKEWQEKEKEKEHQRREIGRARKEIETRKSLDERHHEQSIKRSATPRETIQAPPPIKRSPSPPLNIPSRILHIEHLKRPFTILQLKELLQEDGPMINGGFWTNKIKSHCIAIFVSTDIAIATRNRLHGMKWPSTNPQLLRVDYLTNKQVSEVSEGCLIIDSRSPSPSNEVGVARGGATETLPQKKNSVEKTIPLIIEKKEVVQAPPTKEEKATRMLDDLFNKTKATPPIYWMALPKEEMDRKIAERLAREKEREKRREERKKEHDEQMEKEKRERKDSYRNRSPPVRRRSRSPRGRSPRGRSPRRRSPRGRSPRGRSPRRSRSPRRR